MTSCTAVCQTLVGGGSFCAEITPAVLANCQTNSTTSGLISRYHHLVLRRSRRDEVRASFLLIRPGSGNVRGLLRLHFPTSQNE